MVGDAFRLYPTGSLLAVTLLTLYAIPLIAFVYRLDLFEREPVTMVAAAFAWGGLAATSLALSGNQAIFGLASKLGGPDFAGRWGPALAAPPIEETLKILGRRAPRPHRPRPVRLAARRHGLRALVGLGFQVVEDFIYCINAITLAGGDGEIGPVLGTFVVRALVGSGATPPTPPSPGTAWATSPLGATGGWRTGCSSPRAASSSPTRPTSSGTRPSSWRPSAKAPASCSVSSSRGSRSSCCSS